MSPDQPGRRIDRRSFLLATAGTTLSLTGCGDKRVSVPTPNRWAAGGTAAMIAKDGYPNPFETAVHCPLICTTTAGPCTATSPLRQDISEGWAGLPVRLLLRVVDDQCAPVVGATVEVWHTQRSGVYSGETPFEHICHGDDADATNHSYFRGMQTTDSAGIATFDTCYPGWYPGRVVHFHFSVDRAPETHVTSQLFFPDALNAEVFAAHPEYSGFGPPDTTLSQDSVIGGETDVSAYLLDYQRMDDGAMLAWKTVAVTAGGPGCQAEGVESGG